jgi:bifunctional enzyme CysN/CysC
MQAIEYCRKNKPDLYEKADQGLVTSFFLAVDMEFDQPQNAGFVFKPEHNSANVEVLLDFLARKRVYPVK